MPSVPRMPRVFAITPERRALLNTIRYAEGTWKEGADIGYRVMFGGSLMKTLDRHPDRVNYTSGYASAAAGAYQFMPATWRLAVRALDLVGFGPHAQDQAALYLIKNAAPCSWLIAACSHLSWRPSWHRSGLRSPPCAATATTANRL